MDGCRGRLTQSRCLFITVDSIVVPFSDCCVHTLGRGSQFVKKIETPIETSKKLPRQQFTRVKIQHSVKSNDFPELGRITTGSTSA